MALLNSFGASNQMLESPLKITTSRVQIGNRDGLPIFENHRFAKKEWSWVGMSEATARACVRYVQKKYTRTFKQLYDEAGNQVSTEMTICVADASCSRSGEGSMWNVGVSLDEEQVQYTLGNNEPLWDDSCDYDEMPVKGAYLRMYNLAKASDGETVSFNYDQIITGFNFAALEIEAAPTASGEWVSVKNYIRTRKAPSADYGEGGNIGVWIPPGNAYIRIRWGNALATEAQMIPDHVFANTLTIDRLYYQNGFWMIDYSHDIPNFDVKNLRVHARTGGAIFDWGDITDDCSITGNRVITDNTNQNTSFYEVRLVYDSLSSEVEGLPYDYKADNGNGHALIVGASHRVTMTASDEYHFQIAITKSTDINDPFSEGKVPYSSVELKKSFTNGKNWTGEQLSFNPALNLWTGIISVDAINQALGNDPFKSCYFKAFGSYQQFCVGTEDNPEFNTFTEQVTGTIKLPWATTQALNHVGIEIVNGAKWHFVISNRIGFATELVQLYKAPINSEEWRLVEDTDTEMLIDGYNNERLTEYRIIEPGEIDLTNPVKYKVVFNGATESNVMPFPLA